MALSIDKEGDIKEIPEVSCYFSGRMLEMAGFSVTIYLWDGWIQINNKQFYIKFLSSGERYELDSHISKNIGSKFVSYCHGDKSPQT